MISVVALALLVVPVVIVCVVLVVRSFASGDKRHE